MKDIRRLFRGAIREDKGITGLETAIILIAFVVVATVFAFVVLTTGIFSSERGKETVFAGLQKARGTMEVRGGVVASASGVPLSVDSIQLSVATTAGGEAIGLDPSATVNRTVIAYRDNAVIDDDLTYTVAWIVGDADNLLESGELAVVSITPPGTATLDPNDRFTMEVQTPVGAVLDITRTLPAEIEPVMQLH